jgi:hypothetical protein
MCSIALLSRVHRPIIPTVDERLRFLLASNRNFGFASLQAGGLPVDGFAPERTVRLNGSTAALKYYGAAHTGDTFWNGIYPFIDYSTGGNIDGMIRAADANLAASTDRTLVIPGHGQPVSNRAQLQEYRDMLVAIRGNVVALKQQCLVGCGHSRGQTDGRFRRQWGGFVIDSAFFTRLVYEGV